MRGEAAEIVDTLLRIMKETLVVGEDVMSSGFGKWTGKDKHARPSGKNKMNGKSDHLMQRIERVFTGIASCGVRLPEL
jgi:nucleoid DNA-binding protein